MALTNKLTAIGDAIRNKTGSTNLLTLDEMPTAIESIEGGGGGGADIDESNLAYRDNCTYAFAYNRLNWLIDSYGDKITTNNISNGTYMFYSSTELEEIPFELNFGTAKTDVSSMFNTCKKLKSIPKINNLNPDILSTIFKDCWSLREIPEDIDATWNWTTIDNQTSAYSNSRSSQFYNCYALRKIPNSFLNHNNKLSTNSYAYFYNGFSGCYTLDELVELPIPFTSEWTTNAFNSTFTSCFRLKRVTFETNEDGSPKVMKWKSQTIDASSLGVASSGNMDTYKKYHGIPTTKEVKDDATYQALKNDPDWYACNYYYSRYDKASAIETINSLPDTSAYLASKGGTNTIKLKSIAGRYTDGGEIGTLTEEEIAVATAKGWTVTFV